MNKKGDFTGILFLLVSVGAFAIFLLIVGYIAPLITSEVQSQIGITAGINNSLLTTTNITTNTLPVLWLIMFGGLTMGLFITAYFVPTHPGFAPVFGLLLIVTVIVSIALSNAYEELQANAILSGAAAQQGLIGFIMLNLPYTVLIISLIVMVITFSKPSETGGSVVVPV